MITRLYYSFRRIAFTAAVTLFVSNSIAVEVRWNMVCNNTTESDDDKVYIIVAGRTSDGREFKTRLPDDTGHWTLNESKPTRNVNDIVLANIPLAPGQAAKLVVVLLEGGGGTSKPWQEIGVAVLATIPTNVTQAIGAFASTISQFITFADSDDYLGSFEITISNDAGSIASQWRPLEHSKQIPESDPPPGRNGFRFDGDGSNYYGWGFVKP